MPRRVSARGLGGVQRATEAQVDVDCAVPEGVEEDEVSEFGGEVIEKGGLGLRV